MKAINEQRCILEVEERLVSEDLFDFPVFVVTIKTRGRIYGAISKDMKNRYPTVRFPDLGWGLSSPVIDLPDGKKVIFTCLWKDQETGEGYPPHVISGCTASAIGEAAKAGCEEIAMPLIGGGKKRERIPWMGHGILEKTRQIEDRGMEPPEVLIAMGKPR